MLLMAVCRRCSPRYSEEQRVGRTAGGGSGPRGRRTLAGRMTQPSFVIRATMPLDAPVRIRDR